MITGRTAGCWRVALPARLRPVGPALKGRDMAGTDFSTSEGRDRIIQKVKSKYPEFNARKARLIWFCTDMIRRVESSGDDDYGGFERRLAGACALAFSLGFDNPPIQVMTYSAPKHEIRILPAFGSLCEPPQWADLKCLRPEIVFAAGYRVHDPAGGYRDLHVECAGYSDDPNITEIIREVASEAEIAENKNWILRQLKLWISAVEGKQAPITPTKASGNADESEVDPLVTFATVAPVTGLRKRTLDGYLRKGKLPDPDIRGGGGRPHKWHWSRLRPDLEKVSRKILPEKFPHWDHLGA